MDTDPRNSMPKQAAVSSAALIVPVVLGLLILAREFIIQAPRHSVGVAAMIFFWCSLPILIAGLVGLSPKLRAVGVGIASATLVSIMYSHYVFFVAPDSTSNNLGLIFLPIFNLFLIGPAGGLVAWLATRHRDRLRE